MNEAQRSNLRGTLSSLLERTKATLPFPAEALDVYRNAFGEHSELVLSSFVPDDDMLLETYWRVNLRSAFNMGRIVHFALQPHQIFWIEFDTPVAMPKTPQSVFMLSLGPQLNSLLTEWWHAASEMDRFIDDAVYTLYQVTGVFTNRAELFAVWPELAMAVPAVMQGMGRGRPSNLNLTRVLDLKDRVNMLMKPERRERLVDSLAKGVLLPPAITPTAWVNRYMPKEGE